MQMILFEYSLILMKTLEMNEKLWKKLGIYLQNYLFFCC